MFFRHIDFVKGQSAQARMNEAAYQGCLGRTLNPTTYCNSGAEECLAPFVLAPVAGEILLEALVSSISTFLCILNFDLVKQEKMSH